MANALIIQSMTFEMQFNTDLNTREKNNETKE